MELKEHNIHGRVRENTPEEINLEIDEQVLTKIKQYGNLSAAEITQRLDVLRNEWDIERTLEVNASVFMLAGLVMGKLLDKRWYLLSATVAAFLLQHGLQGWCPPLPLFRALGVRTRQEIDEEIYALKVLRGDLDTISASSGPVEVMKSFRS
jgi:hypothetical protein